jgi:hypothetical protein
LDNKLIDHYKKKVAMSDSWKPLALYHKETHIKHIPAIINQYIGKEEFFLLENISKHCRMVIVCYADCRPTNTPYFKEKTTKHMKRYNVSVKEHSLTVHMKTADFRTLHIGTWIHS